MATFTLGRIGAAGDTTHVTLEFIDRWDISADGRRIRHRIRGEAVSATKAAIEALANEMYQMIGQTVALTFTEYAGGDRFYRVTDVDIDISDASFADAAANNIPFDLTVEEVGSQQAVKFESAIQGLIIDNDYGLIEAEVDYTWAPPVGAQAISDAGSPSAFDRATVAGTIRVFKDVDKTLAPTWSVTAANYYKGATKITLGGKTRTGLDAPEDLTSWKITTGIVDLFADGTNDGVLNLQHAVDQTPYGFKIKFAGTTAIPAWNYPSIVYNTPEVSIFSITRDADEADPTSFLHYLEIIARRGMPFFILRFAWTGNAVTWSVDRETVDAATAITPAGASGNMAVEDSADDGDGNRWFLGGWEHSAVDTTNGGLDWPATNEFACVLGIEDGGSAAAANDDTGAVMLQASAWLWEITRSMRR
jgi:hypothetical protein